MRKTKLFKKFICFSISALLLVCTIPCIAFASDEEDCDHYWYYSKSVKIDDDQHYDVYKCDYCSATRKVAVVHVWEEYWDDDMYQILDSQYHKIPLACKRCGAFSSDYVKEEHVLGYGYDNYGDYEVKDYNATYHKVKYRCEHCPYVIQINENHKWTKSDKDYDEIDSTYHYKNQYYCCEICDREKKPTVTTEKHAAFTWFTDYSGGYYYGCKKCEYYKEYTESKSKSVTVKKSGKHTLKYRCTKHDKLKSVKILSGKSVISIKTKGNSKTTYKCKKKGSAKVKIYMFSGAKYTFKIKVK